MAKDLNGRMIKNPIIKISFSPFGNYTVSYYDGKELIASSCGISGDDCMNELRCWLSVEGRCRSIYNHISEKWKEFYYSVIKPR